MGDMEQAPRPTPRSPYACETCGKDCKTAHGLREHQKWVHNQAPPSRKEEGVGVVEGVKVGVRAPSNVGGGGVKGSPEGVKPPPTASAAEVERLRRRVAEIRTAVAARDEELARLKGAVKKRERAVADAREALERKDRKIAGLERDLEAEKGPPMGEVAYYLCRTSGCRKVLRVTLDEGEAPEDFEGRCPECKGRVDLRPDIDDNRTAKRVANDALRKDEQAEEAARPAPRFAACPNRACRRVTKLRRSGTTLPECEECGDRVVEIAEAHNIHDAAKLCEETWGTIDDYLKARKGEYKWGLRTDFPGYTPEIGDLADKADWARIGNEKTVLRIAKRNLGRELFIFKVGGASQSP